MQLASVQKCYGKKYYTNNTNVKRWKVDQKRNRPGQIKIVMLFDYLFRNN